MKKLICALLFALALPLALAPGLFAQAQAVIREVTGKVEIKAAAGAWQTARPGTKLDTGWFISTGFGSRAVLDLGGSRLTVAPLTRMQLSQLVVRQGTQSTEVVLKVGRVRAEVKATEGIRQDFVLKAPSTTAAVRGTEFVFDGLGVQVVNGVVFFSNSLGQGRGVGAGEASFTDGNMPPSTGDSGKETEVAVVPYTGKSGGGIAAAAESTTSVTIKWQ